MAKLTPEEQAVIDEAAQPDPTIAQPPGNPTDGLVIRSLTRDDGNINQTAPSPMQQKRMNIIQHEFSPLVRTLDDEQWANLARADGGVNWRIIRQYFVD